MIPPRSVHGRKPYIGALCARVCKSHAPIASADHHTQRVNTESGVSCENGATRCDMKSPSGTNWENNRIFSEENLNPKSVT
eukprot:8838075-Pyramimonas_sp.AAC.1